MNDGYIAVWFLTMGLILFMTGWHEQVADQLSRHALSLILMGAFVLQALNIPLSAELSIKGSVVFIFAIAVGSVLSLRRSAPVLFVLVCGVLTGMIWLWIRYMYMIDPVFILMKPLWDGPLIAGLFSGLLCDRFRTQAAVAVIASIIAPFNGVLHAWNGLTDPIIVIGSLAWWDSLIIAIVVARLISNAKGWLRRKTVHAIDEPAGQREGG